MQQMMRETLSVSPNRRVQWAILLVLTVVSAVPRFANLGRLSFYADEEISSFPARSLAEGGGPVQPSGMEYRRALPLTWLTAASAKIFGVDKEASYRVPVAVFGTLTVPLLLLVGRRLVGWDAALVAAFLLAVSEWHLAFSRQARMYVPFLFFFILACYGSWQWARSGRGRDLALAVVTLLVAGSLHLLAIAAVVFAIIPALLSRDERTGAPKWALFLFAAAGAETVFLYDERFVSPAYRAMQGWVLPAADQTVARARISGGQLGTVLAWFPERLAILPSWVLVLMLGGLVLGLWMAVAAVPQNARIATGPTNTIGRLAAAGMAGAALGLGQLYAAALLGAVFFLLAEQPERELATRIRLPLLVGGVLAVGWIAWAVFEFGLVEGLKFTLLYPFPYPLMLFLAMPGLMLLFFAVTAWLCLQQPKLEPVGLRVTVLGVLLLFAGLGLASRWGGLRYLLPVYPWLLLIGATGLVAALDALGGRLRGGRTTGFGVLLGIVVVASGVLGGHGVPQAWKMLRLQHGEPVNAFLHTYPFRPDHRGAGRFVRRVRESGDVVIAEDPMEQRWYAGAADFWFRRYGDARRYLYAANDGRLRDIYVNSAILPEASAVDSVLQVAAGRVWFITSGETVKERESYLSPAQRSWLDSLQLARTPAYTAGDDVTKVYCLNCSEGEFVPTPNIDDGG